MSDQTRNLLAADALLFIHVLFVVFAVGGVVLVLIGGLRHWSWVRNPWFRIAHVIAIGIVVLQAWLGEICFLTKWEMSLRAQAGDAVYSGAFIAHWLGELLYFQAPMWVFTTAYSAFGALVLASWWWVKPHSFARR